MNNWLKAFGTTLIVVTGIWTVGSLPTTAHAATTDVPTTAPAETPDYGIDADATYTVYAKLPSSSTITLGGAAGFVYYLFDTQGKKLTPGLAGDSTWETDRVLINLLPKNAANDQDIKTAGVYYHILNTDLVTNGYVKQSTGVTLNDGTDVGTADTVLHLQFHDENGQALTTDQQIQDTAITLPKELDDATATNLKTALTAVQLSVKGYTLKSAKWGTTDDTANTLTYTYQKDQQPTPTPDPEPTPNPQPTPEPTPEPETPTKPTEPTTPSIPGSDSSHVAVKGEAIYALKKVGLYRHVTFTANNRQVWYPKQSRHNRPQFVVTGYAHTKTGVLRYHVRDINHHSKTAGLTGYLTARSAYVAPLYYQQRPRTIRVLNPKGINAYQHVNLTGRVRHYKRGTTLKIKGIQSHHLTTRLILTNGHYITGNKTLVIQK